MLPFNTENVTTSQTKYIIHNLTIIASFNICPETIHFEQLIDIETIQILRYIYINLMMPKGDCNWESASKNLLHHY